MDDSNGSHLGRDKSTSKMRMWLYAVYGILDQVRLEVLTCEDAKSGMTTLLLTPRRTAWSHYTTHRLTCHFEADGALTVSRVRLRRPCAAKGRWTYNEAKRMFSSLKPYGGYARQSSGGAERPACLSVETIAPWPTEKFRMNQLSQA